MTYFILGSNSFAGTTYIKELLAQGEKIIGISRSPEAHMVLRAYAHQSRLSHFHFYQLDLNNDFAAIKNLIEQQKPKYVVDFASQSMVGESWCYPDQWYQTNIVAKVRLHDFLRNCDFLERYIRISTPEIFGHVEGKIKEDHIFNPTTPYAVSQAAIDMSLMAFYKHYGFPVIFTRYANFYGPYQQFYRIIPKTIIYALLNKKLPLHGGGSSKRAFIYATDIASAIQAAIAKGKLGEAYHFSTGDCISIADLIHKICTLMNKNTADIVEIAAERPGKDFQYFMETQKAKQELEWKPTISLDQGIQNTLAWVEQHINTIAELPLHYTHKP